jgi:WD40 repeat protein
MRAPRLLAAAFWLAVAPAALAAPFVPTRDPQVVAFAPSGSVVATGCSGMSDGSFPPRPHPDVRKCAVVAIWDVATGKRLARMETFGDLTQLEFSPDGKLLAASRLFATTDGVPMHEVRIWDATSGRVLKVLDRCHAFAFAPEGQKVAVVSRSKCVIYDWNDWTKEQHIAPLGGCVSVNFLLDGASLVGVCRQQKEGEADRYLIRKCDISTGKVTGESQPLPNPFYRVVVAPDTATLATGHDGGNVLLWDAANLTPEVRLQTGVRGFAQPFFSPDGVYVGAGCQETGDIIIWKLAGGEEYGKLFTEKWSARSYYPRSADETFRPEKDPLRFMFSPDSEAIFVGIRGGTLRQLDGGRELMRFGD